MKKVMPLVSVFVMAAALSMGCGKADEKERKPVEAQPGTGIAECDSFVAMSEKVLKCEKLPKEHRVMQAQSLVEQKAHWGSLRALNVTAEAKQTAAERCKQADNAMKQVWKAAGCQP